MFTDDCLLIFKVNRKAVRHDKDVLENYNKVPDYLVISQIYDLILKRNWNSWKIQYNESFASTVIEQHRTYLRCQNIDHGKTRCDFA